MAVMNHNSSLFVRYLLGTALLFPFASFGERSYKPSNTTQSYSTMAQAEAAMRAVSPVAARLQFDSLLSDVPTPNSDVFYSVPDVEPNPAVWSDWCNGLGDYTSPQAVCDARRKSIGWSNPLTYVESGPLPGWGNADGYGMWGVCQDLVAHNKLVLGGPQRWRSCPSDYRFRNATISPPYWCLRGPAQAGGGSDLSCGNSLTVTITVLPTAVCPIEPLTPLPSKATDPDTYAFEYEGKQVDISRLNDEMKAALVCLTQKTGQAASSYVSSAWRPPTYQAHLKEVWGKWQLLKELEGAELVACQALYAEVKREVSKHGVAHLETSPAGRNGPHTRGVAFDVKTWFIPRVDTFSSDCKVYRNLKKKDKVHVIHR